MPEEDEAEQDAPEAAEAAEEDTEDAAAGDGGTAALNIGDSAGLKAAVSKLKQKIEVTATPVHAAEPLKHVHMPAAHVAHSQEYVCSTPVQPAASRSLQIRQRIQDANSTCAVDTVHV